jgi:ATPase family associated with various cellular activities (AAA)
MAVNITNMIAGGGIVAMISVAWTHIKSIYQKVSGLIIIRAEIRQTYKHSVVEYLFDEWKQPPRTIKKYNTALQLIKSRKEYYDVPYLIHQVDGFNYRKGKIIHVSYKGDKLHLATLRWHLNFESFLIDSYDHQYTNECRIRDNIKHKPSLYHRHEFGIINLVGRDASVFSNNKEAPSKGTLSEAQSSSHETIYHSQEDIFSYRNSGSFYFAKSEFEHEDLDPYKELYLDDHVVDHVNDARKWFMRQSWYQDRSIPWRRGWLLYGPGGCGKSSLVRALAEDLGIRIYKFHLATMSDQEFMDYWNEMYGPCVVLFEDFDAIFNKRESLIKNKSLSFDTILNKISGVESIGNGIFLIITTNDITKIDPAMGVASINGQGISTRPGRVDAVIHMGCMNKKNRYKMANKILRDWPEEIPTAVAEGEGYTPVQFRESLIRIALQKL